ncbi:DUF4238 domain-containing protein [Spirosoma arboris]|nr:DUF4238 domain-containing protein [Spirosoma arboris]
MAQQKPVKSHIVPKAYLNNFTKSNGKLFKLRTDLQKRPRPTEVHPSGICYQKGFYQFNDANPIQGYTINETNILEDYGFLYENKLGKLIERLTTSTDPLPIEVAEEFALMLFDIKARNQYMRQHSFSKQNIHTVINDLLVEHHQRRQELEPILQAKGSTFERLVELTEGLRHDWTKDDAAIKELHNRSLLENKINPSQTRQLVFNKMARGNWTILKTTLNHQFITSDNPGYCQDSNNMIHNTRFIGQVGFLFPLTPYHLLIIVMEGNQLGPLPLQKVVSYKYAEVNWVRGINQTTWQMATKEVYAAHENPLLQTWASLHSSLII